MAVAPVGGVRLVGREVELERLRDAIGRARAGETGCMLLAGEGGVGKSRLIRAAAASAQHDAVALFAGRARLTTPVPFAVVADALRSGLGSHPGTDPGEPFARGLSLVLPELPAAEGGSDMDAGQLRLLALEAVIRVLRGVVERAGAAVLIADDLHIADPESIDAVGYVVGAQIGGLVVLGALRPGESADADALVRSLRRERLAAVLPVGPLPERAVGELVGALLGADPPAPLVADVLARTDGVPLLGMMLKALALPSDRKAELAADFRRNDPRVIRRLLREYVRYLGRHADSAWRLCDVGVPAWIVHAEKGDGGLTTDERRIPEACPLATVVTIPGTSHLLPNEKKAQIAEIIAAAVDAVRPRHL